MLMIDRGANRVYIYKYTQYAATDNRPESSLRSDIWTRSKDDDSWTKKS
jgi:hypothetical protein